MYLIGAREREEEREEAREGEREEEEEESKREIGERYRRRRREGGREGGRERERVHESQERERVVPVTGEGPKSAVLHRESLKRFAALTVLFFRVVSRRVRVSVVSIAKAYD